MNDTENSKAVSQNPPKRRGWSDEKTVDEMAVRLNRIEGQVRGIKRMIQEQAYCDDVLNQIASVQAALNGVSRLLLEKHMKGCVKEQIIAGDDRVFDEIIATVFRMMR